MIGHVPVFGLPRKYTTLNYFLIISLITFIKRGCNINIYVYYKMKTIFIR